MVRCNPSTNGPHFVTNKFRLHHMSLIASLFNLCHINHQIRSRRRRGQSARPARTCDALCTDRVYHILSPQHASFFAIWEQGIPEALWTQIMSGNMIYFGEDNVDRRNVGQAVFEVGHHEYAPAYLMYNTNQRSKVAVKEWWLCSWNAKNVIPFRGAHWSKLRLLFIQPPIRCVSCKEFVPWQNERCDKCSFWFCEGCLDPTNCAGCRMSVAV